MSTKELLHNAVDKMTEEQANAIYTVIQFMVLNKTEKNTTNAQKAYDTIAKLRKPSTTITDEDDKENYYRYLEGKYKNKVTALTPEDFLQEYQKAGTQP